MPTDSTETHYHYVDRTILRNLPLISLSSPKKLLKFEQVNNPPVEQGISDDYLS